jgi:thymidylate synthase
MNIFNITGSTIAEIQHDLINVITKFGKQTRDSYDMFGRLIINIPHGCDLESHPKSRNFNLDYSNAFFEYILSGEDMDKHRSKLSELSHGVADKFLVEFEGRNTQYGPRIAKMLPLIVDELKSDKDTRRAFMPIVSMDDLYLLQPKRDGETTIEFPCTASIGFKIVDGRLNSMVTMRSSCAVVVFNYDARNFALLTKKVAELVGVEPGDTKMMMGSCHVYFKYMPLVKAILSEGI